ncbi:unnamed protein product [Leptosia nina]|uniref:Uncharacterized protein n=1 Tax=Leptosia nina TaxID=320188 RepID=A0AAV1JVP7_9NEOP
MNEHSAEHVTSVRSKENPASLRDLSFGRGLTPRWHLVKIGTFLETFEVAGQPILDLGALRGAWYYSVVVHACANERVRGAHCAQPRAESMQRARFCRA